MTLPTSGRPVRRRPPAMQGFKLGQESCDAIPALNEPGPPADLSRGGPCCSRVEARVRRGAHASWLSVARAERPWYQSWYQFERNWRDPGEQIWLYRAKIRLASPPGSWLWSRRSRVRVPSLTLTRKPLPRRVLGSSGVLRHLLTACWLEGPSPIPSPKLGSRGLAKPGCTQQWWYALPTGSWRRRGDGRLFAPVAGVNPERVRQTTLAGAAGLRGVRGAVHAEAPRYAGLL